MRQQAGNILFLILLAVVLFAALSYAVTSSMRGGGRDGSGESGRTAAADIINYATSIEQAIQRLMLINDCKDTQISFWTDTNNDGAETVADTYYNANAPSSKKCHVFLPEGGNVPYKAIDPKYYESSYSAEPGYGNYFFTGSNQVVGIGTSCEDTSCSDLILYAMFLKKGVCEALSEGLLGRAPPLADASGWLAFRGLYTTYTFSDKGILGENKYDENYLVSRPSGCINRTGSTIPSRGYVFYHVLIAR